MDNEPVAPVIPSGTEPTVFGTASFQGNGQAATSPDKGQSKSESAQADPSSDASAPQGTTFEELASKKGFKSADDLAAAYANLESQNKRVEMGFAELAKIRETTQSEFVPDVSNVQTPEDAQRIVEGIVKKFTRPLEDKIALQDLFFKNPDAAQYAASMAKLVKDSPGMNWEHAYKVAKFDDVAKQATEKAKQEVYQAIQQKQAVATAPARASAKDTRPLAELIKDKSIPFVEIQRIMKERFSQ